MATKSIFRYLKGSNKLGLTFRLSDNAMTDFVDSDWARDQDDRKSTCGYVFMLGNGCISWSCRKQSSVALSSTEAEYMGVCHATKEYMGVCHATKEYVWLGNLMDELGIERSGMTLQNDNQGCLFLSRNAGIHKRRKHISIQYHFIRDLVQEASLVLRYCPTDRMLADILTKALVKQRFVFPRNLLGISSYNPE
ncbi:hypothetical protein O6H91_13G089700 [Diphasiastrum complanatum]|uniref:Uncharacterized protein n=1 Tax=Diphasiastrum complanatum TaxID=34168 RepID=A0ACC2BXA0_DIPCM|nr:hypothetical protein O6H91_13G089700 [Diphasiastrum complanatum]